MSEIKAKLSFRSQIIIEHTFKTIFIHVSNVGNAEAKSSILTVEPIAFRGIHAAAEDLDRHSVVGDTLQVPQVQKDVRHNLTNAYLRSAHVNIDGSTHSFIEIIWRTNN
jgi:hypothetical protein